MAYVENTVAYGVKTTLTGKADSIKLHKIFLPMEACKQANQLLNLINREAEEKLIYKTYVELIGSEPNVVSRAKILVNEARKNFKNGDSLIDKLLRIDAKYF